MENIIAEFPSPHPGIINFFCTMLCEKKDVVDSINAALVAAGIEGLKIQLNWSDDNGSTWSQYPKSH